MKKIVITFDDVIEIMQFKIKKELYQTDIENREDLLQEIYLMILKTLNTLEIYQKHSLLELIQKDNWT